MLQYQTKRFVNIQPHIELSSYSVTNSCRKKGFQAIENPRDKYRSTKLRVESKHSVVNRHIPRQIRAKGVKIETPKSRVRFFDATGTTAAE